MSDEHKTDIDRLADVLERIAADSTSTAQSNKVISGAAVAIALVAVFVALWQGCETRRYQRLSVQPNIRTSRYYNQRGVQFEYHNSGLGPAQIKWFEVAVDDKPQPHWTAMCMSLDVSCMPYSFLVPNRGGFQPVGPPEIVFSIADGDAARQIWANRQRIGISVCYCSLYDDCWINARGVVSSVSACDPAPDVVFGMPP